MPTDQRRAAARRRAWGRGPMILRFEPLEGRQLLAAGPALPDLVGQSFQTPTDLTWGSTFTAKGVVANQGSAPAAGSFQVDIYASPTPIVGQGAVLLGEATIPAGLQPGATSAFNQPLTIPSTPLTGLGPSGSFYVAMVIDPKNAVAESNKQNNADVGAGYDYQLVTPPSASQASLAGTGLGLSVSQTDWGGTFQVTQQVTNTGAADAPATRAVVMLTPAGSATGMSLGSVNVPAIPAGQSVTINPSYTLPQTPPASLAGATSFTVSVIQDADYVTNRLYPHAATQGSGLDQAPLTITTPSFAGKDTSAKPALQVSGVVTDSASVKWGQSFQVGYTLANAGTAAAGPFHVEYVLVGSDGTISNGLFLAQSSVNGLAAGSTQTVETQLSLPAAPPAGQTVNSLAQARVAVLVDPENTLSESVTNTTAVSNLIQLQLVGTDGTTTPVTPPAAANSTATAAATATATAAKAPAAKPAVSVKGHPTTAKAAPAAKARTKPKPSGHSVEHNLKVIPRDIADYYKKIFKIK